MGDKLAGSTLVVGGDGRYYGKEATEKIIRMCAANKVYSVVSVTCCSRSYCSAACASKLNLNKNESALCGNANPRRLERQVALHDITVYGPTVVQSVTEITQRVM